MWRNKQIEFVIFHRKEIINILKSVYTLNQENDFVLKSLCYSVDFYNLYQMMNG